jgi:hypothetical protein
MAAISASTANQIAILKELYVGDEYLKDLVYAKNPMLALVPKDESPQGMGGKYLPVPIIFGTPQGRSASFANAQSNQTPPQVSSFFVQRVRNYALCTIDNELLEATKGDAAAFIDEGKLAMDTTVRNFANDIAHDLYTNGSGTRGQIATITTGVIQLTNISDVVQFEVGMTLVAYTISGNVYTQTSGAALGYVISVNRGLGRVTVSATGQGGSAGTPTNWVATDFIGVQGDVAFGTIALQTSFQKLAGLQAWLPSTPPSPGENFFNVDRSVDTRLYGQYQDNSALTIEEGLVNLASQIAQEGGQPEMCFMNFASYAALENSLGAKVQYVDVKHEEADIAFAGIRIHGPYGPITVIPDKNCPSKTAFMLQMEDWKLRTLNKAPHILRYGMEGLEALRVGNADAVEIRWGLYGNLVCRAPGWSGSCSLSS